MSSEEMEIEEEEHDESVSQVSALSCIASDKRTNESVARKGSGWSSKNNHGLC